MGVTALEIFNPRNNTSGVEPKFYEFDRVSVRPGQGRRNDVIGFIQSIELPTTLGERPRYVVAYGEPFGANKTYPTLTDIGEVSIDLIERGPAWRYWRHEAPNFRDPIQEASFLHSIGKSRQLVPADGTPWSVSAIETGMRQRLVDFFIMPMGSSGTLQKSVVIQAYRLPDDRNAAERIRHLLLDKLKGWRKIHPSWT